VNHEPLETQAIQPQCGGAALPPLRIAIVYDCFYPCTIGGAERWYRALAEHLARHHQVTFLTRRQWERGAGPQACGFHLIGFPSGRQLYTRTGRRRIGPPLRFGLKVLLHLLRHRRRYDVVHTCSFPYFPMLFAGLARTLGGPAVVVDWVEVWEVDYWRRYLGRIGGTLGAWVQRLALATSGPAVVFSERAAQGLRQHGWRSQVYRIAGQHVAPPPRVTVSLARLPLVVFAGRHIDEKNVTAIPSAVALAHKRIAGLRAVIFGDGPRRRGVLAEIRRLGLETVISCPGFVAWEEVDRALCQALCLLLPSIREGYGMVVIEAAARATPAIVVPAPANAAADLVTDRVNGLIAASPAPRDLADAIVVAHALGQTLVESTRQWFARHGPELRLERAAAVIESAYRAAAGERPHAAW
jgi:glycosyltransferase involved in cell wall biosynthesis